MEPIARNSLVDAVEVRLLEELTKGTWEDELPGVRVLCTRFKVSVPTMSAALKRMIDRGVLENRGARRRLGINIEKLGVSESSTATGKKRLLIINHHPLNLVANSTRTVLELLQNELGTTDWSISYEVMDFFNAKQPRRSWDEVLRSVQPDAMLGVFGRPVLAEWAQKHKKRLLFLGGVPGETGVPIYAVRMADILRDAVRKLLQAGHRKFFLPLCERGEPFVASLSAVMREELEAAGVPFVPRIHMPTVAYSGPEVIWRMAETAWQGFQPTAWIILDWREMVTVLSFFHEHGIFVPKDVSVMLLNDEATVDWHRPRLCRYTLPIEKLARGLARWVEGKVDVHESKHFEPLWIDGESIGAPSSEAPRLPS